jgi:hypothetical protein
MGMEIEEPNSEEPSKELLIIVCPSKMASPNYYFF